MFYFVKLYAVEKKEDTKLNTTAGNSSKSTGSGNEIADNAVDGADKEDDEEDEDDFEGDNEDAVAFEKDNPPPSSMSSSLGATGPLIRRGYPFDDSGRFCHNIRFCH